ncbi:MAG: DUF971 domain-containing protein [Actinomycetia bacterium]|nr:DUF971 domain-containing protein [Actinomycetes bacterium]
MIEPKRIEVQNGTMLVIEWVDGRTDSIAATRLRDGCLCASCRTISGGMPAADEATCRISDISLVGGYAINVVFAPDGHGTGIYPYSALRDLGEA